MLADKVRNQITVKVLSVRLTEPEMRRFKSVAASRGVSVQKAVQEALNLWEAQRPPSMTGLLDELEGSLAGSDVLELKRQEKEVEFAKDRRWL
ncbi:MAG: hypothetical protein ACR2I2_16960 [Bryobacteraceae bacterium]